MTTSDLKKYYTRFLSLHEGKLHFAAHSHHFWPDVTREAHLAYWDDCARLSDSKWEKIFSDVIPKAQNHIARLLNLQHPEQIAFAPNTHELSCRILSLFAGRPSIKVLSTTSEFHSWRRQISRLQELPSFQVDLVDTSQFLEKKKEIIQEIKAKLKARPDLFFISQVFFDSGLAFTDQELLELTEHAAEETVIVVDGYHAFGALPVNLEKLEGRIFYLGGGYKYAQAGEGVGFLVIPKSNWRPAYTGWFAEMGELSCPTGSKVGYSSDGLAFMGATQDPSGLYRFNAVWDLFEREGLSLKKIHEHVISLQKAFLQNLPESFTHAYQLTPLFQAQSLSWHGHFLTFEAPTLAEALALETALKERHVLIDLRGQRLRFGFGTYQDIRDVEALAQKIKDLIAELN
jgi:selenocysteine lyase/cysteine desulfurase